jgi:hypothetical protein
MLMGLHIAGLFLLKEFSKLLVLHTILLQYIRFNINLIKP